MHLILAPCVWFWHIACDFGVNTHACDFDTLLVELLYNNINLRWLQKNITCLISTLRVILTVPYCVLNQQSWVFKKHAKKGSATSFLCRFNSKKSPFEHFHFGRIKLVTKGLVCNNFHVGENYLRWDFRKMGFLGVENLHVGDQLYATIIIFDIIQALVEFTVILFFCFSYISLYTFLVGLLRFFFQATFFYDEATYLLFCTTQFLILYLRV
jgi:hypothetical protein